MSPPQQAHVHYVPVGVSVDVSAWRRNGVYLLKSQNPRYFCLLAGVTHDWPVHAPAHSVTWFQPAYIVIRQEDPRMHVHPGLPYDHLGRHRSRRTFT